jgi:hypothetical protein
LKDVNTRVAAAASMSPDDLMITLYEAPGENFSFGQGEAQRANAVLHEQKSHATWAFDFTNPYAVLNRPAPSREERTSSAFTGRRASAIAFMQTQRLWWSLWLVSLNMRGRPGAASLKWNLAI